jgi:hypothetical protein
MIRRIAPPAACMAVFLYLFERIASGFARSAALQAFVHESPWVAAMALFALVGFSGLATGIVIAAMLTGLREDRENGERD